MLPAARLSFFSVSPKLKVSSLPSPLTQVYTTSTFNIKKLPGVFFIPSHFRPGPKTYPKLNTNGGSCRVRWSLRGNKSPLMVTEPGFSAAKVSFLTTPFIPIFSFITAMIKTSSLHNDSKTSCKRQVQAVG